MRVLGCFLVDENDFCGFRVSFEPISKKSKKTDKAITRISNFSVARVGTPAVGDRLHSLSNTRTFKIRVIALSGFLGLFWKSVFVFRFSWFTVSPVSGF